MEVIKLKKIISILFCLLFTVIMMASTVFGMEPAHNDKNTKDSYEELVVEENIKINNDIFEFVRSFKNEGIIVGDLFVVGREILNEGLVKGDILGLNYLTYISGRTKGNVRVWTKNLNVEGEVFKNVSAITENLYIHESGAIDGSITIIADKVEVAGLVCSDIRGKVNTLIIKGEVKGDVDVEVDNIIFGNKGIVKGDLNYKSQNKILMPKYKIHGDVNFIKKQSPQKSYKTQLKKIFIRGFSYFLKFLALMFKCI